MIGSAFLLATESLERSFQYEYSRDFNAFNKWVHFYHSGNYIVFWGIKKICKKTNTTSYYNSIYILLLPNWYSDNDRYWQAESISTLFHLA